MNTAPKNVTVQPSRGRVVIQWDAVGGAEWYDVRIKGMGSVELLPVTACDLIYEGFGVRSFTVTARRIEDAIQRPSEPVYTDLGPPPARSN